MTEHDHTGQTATEQDPQAGPPAGDRPATASPQPVAPDQPASTGPATTSDPHAGPEQQPALPSPYLSPGEDVPQAYLAPPQPGQPSYGSQPASGQRAFGRPPGRPNTGQRSGPGPRSGRDPVLAAPWERLAACVLDWGIIFTVSVLAFLSPLLRIMHEYRAVLVRYPNLSAPGAQAAVAAIAKDPANQRALLFWFLGMFAIALVYYWVQHAAWGATIGKRVLGTKVVSAADRSRVSAGAAGLRAIAFLIGPAVFLLLVSPVNVVGGLLWLADTMTPLVDSRAQCLHDKLTGTIVVSQRRLRSQARSPW